MVVEAERKGVGAVTVNVDRVSFGADENVLELDSGDGGTALRTYKMPLKCTF